MDFGALAGNVQTFAPLLGGFGLVIWLGWRLFWKVDRRSQLELAAKDKTIAAKDIKIKELEAEIELEKTKRFAAQEANAEATAKQKSMEIQVHELAEQVGRQAIQIDKLRQEIQHLRDGGNG